MGCVAWAALGHEVNEESGTQSYGSGSWVGNEAIC